MNRRQQLKQSNFNARTLIIQKEPDVAKSYNAVMNCIFCAQKLNILVDCLVVGPQESSFLQVCITLFYTMWLIRCANMVGSDNVPDLLNYILRILFVK